jgi:pimeloyl-ACP methyl ester carboxylesterase
MAHLLKIHEMGKLKNRCQITLLLCIMFHWGFAQEKNSKLMKYHAYQQDVEFLKINEDLEIAYTDEGKGEILFFVHGLASYLPAWKKNISELKSRYRCIAIDLPGFGKSSKPNSQMSMESYAEVIMGFCSKLKLNQITLIGHSMGAQISMTAALKYPNLVKQLILFAPAGLETFNKGQKQWFRDVMSVDAVRLTTAEQIRVNYYFNFYRMPKDAEFMVQDRLNIRSCSDFKDFCYHVVQGVNAMVNQPVYDLLPNINQRTMIVFGVQDNLIPNRFLHGGRAESVGKKGIAHLKNANLKMISRAGHFVMFEKADESNVLIQEFMAN